VVKEVAAEEAPVMTTEAETSTPAPVDSEPTPEPVAAEPAPEVEEKPTKKGWWRR